MFALYVAIAAVVVPSVLFGQAIWLVCGFRRGSFVAPAVGFAALLIVADVAAGLPGATVTAAAVVLALTLLCVGVLVAKHAIESGPVLRAGVPVALVGAALVSLPFLVSGHVGALGVGNNNDMSVHMLAAWWLQHHPAVDNSQLIGAGYPLGPHAVAATVSTGLGVSLEDAFTAVVVSVPILASLAALGAMRPPVGASHGRLAGLGQLGRGALALLAGFAYLATAYAAQASFKETIQGLIVLAFALVLRELERAGAASWRRRAARAVPLGILAAGSVYTYSYVGVAWPLAVAACWIVLKLVLGRPRPALLAPWHAIRTAIGPLLAAAATFVVVTAPDVPRLITFSASQYNNEPPHGVGNLILGPISGREVLGVWFRSDFRLSLPVGSEAGILGVIALVGIVLAIVWWLRRGDVAVPAGVAGASALYLYARYAESPYATAKALAICAPVVMLALVCAFAVGWRTGLRPGWHALGGWLRARASRGRLRPGTLSWPALGACVGQAVVVVALVGAAYSSFVVLRDASVGPQDHARELASLRPLLGDQPTLFLGNDDYINWELRGVNLSKPPLLYPLPFVALSATKFWQPGLPFDMDSVPTAALNGFTYVIMPRSAFISQPPRNWRPVKRTRSFVLFKRHGTTAPRDTLDEEGHPGEVLDCSSPTGALVRGLGGVAGVMPEPITGSRTAWTGRTGLAGKSAQQTLTLPPGTWDISMQYVSRLPVHVSAPGMHALPLPATLARSGPYWLAGTISVDHTTSVPITVTTAPVSRFGKLLRARGHTVALNSRKYQALGSIAATRHGARDLLVPLSQACGKYVDWYRPAHGAS